MTKNVNITGGVSAIGAIETYQEDGVTPLTSHDFPLFIGGIPGNNFLTFFINNTGNQPVYVTWNISTSSISWDKSPPGYEHREGGVSKYSVLLWEGGDTGGWWWAYTTGAPEETIALAVGEGVTVSLNLGYSGQPATGETFSLVMSFYARDSTG